MKIKQALLAALVSVASFAPIAAQANPYATFGVGNVEYSETGIKDAIGYKFGAGYSFNENVALETTYLTSKNSDIKVGDALVANKLSSIALGFVFKAPLKNISVLGRLGMHRWDQKVSAIANGRQAKLTADGTDLYFGAGVEYDITDAIALGGEYTIYQGDDANAKVMALSLKTAF